MARLQVEAALRACGESSPIAAGRAAAAIERILRAHEESAWPEVAWSYSSLTADGFPLELTFAANDASIRWAGEVAAPEIAESRRLGIAFAFDRKSDRAAEWLDRLTRIQAARPLAYGAWAGGRHADDADAHKIYAEVPRGLDGRALAREILGRPCGGLLGRSILRMIGVGLRDGRAELYFRAGRMDTWEIEPLAAEAGIADRAAELVDLVAEITGRGNPATLPWSKVGFSIRPGVPGLSVFGIARSFIGPDGAIRARLLETARRRGWGFSAYDAVTRPLAGARGPRTCHGIVAFCADLGGISLRIGVRPPAIDTAADSYKEGVCDALAR